MDPVEHEDNCACVDSDYEWYAVSPTSSLAGFDS